MLNIVSYISYKGGSGRSTTCLNTIPFLAEECEAFEDAPILLIDMDIESMGMTYLLGKEKYFQDKYDVKDLLRGEENWGTAKMGPLSNHPLYQKFVPVGNQFGLDDDRAVMFLGVNEGGNQIDRKAIDGKVQEVINKLRLFAMNYGVRAIVMDSAAGDQFSARLCVEVSDKIVLCMRPTKQFRVGTFHYLERFAMKFGKNADEKQIIILPTVVPQDTVLDGDSQKEQSINDILDRIGKLPSLDICDEFVSEDMFGINEITRFKWKEEILYKLKKEKAINHDEEEGIKRYSKLASVIME